MTLIDILVIVLILAAFALSIFIIVFLRRILEQVDAVREDIHQLVENTVPVMNNLEEVTKRANNIVTDIEGYWKEIDGLIKNVRERIPLITSLKDFIAVGYPVKHLVKNVRALANGIFAFWKTYKHN